MKAALFNGVLVAALMLATAVGQAADLRVRLDAREVTRKRVHTDLTLAVREGHDMDSPCSFGIGCARLKTVDRSITEQGESG